MELSKKKIMVFVDWYLPAFKAGGPIRSVYNLVSRLSDEYDFYVIAGDRDLGDKTAFADVELNRWLEHKNSNIIYLSKEHQNRKYFSKLILEVGPDFIYINSLFSFSFALLPLSLKNKFPKVQFILAPRGMLGRGALEIKNRKKKFFIGIARSLNLYKGITWHATNDLEEADIIKSFGRRCEIKIADNLASGQSLKFNQLVMQKLSSYEVKRFLFISRISRKKNVHLLIDYFKAIKSKNFDFQLDIIGANEDETYFNELKQQATGYSQIQIQKAKHPEKLKEYYSKAHFFCLATKHENYGHVIIEALSYACPVIISDQTPWRNLNEKNIGWDLSLDDPDAFINTIEKCIKMEKDQYQNMSMDSYNFAQEHIVKEDVLNAYRNLLS